MRLSVRTYIRSSKKTCPRGPPSLKRTSIFPHWTEFLRIQKLVIFVVTLKHVLNHLRRTLVEASSTAGGWSVLSREKHETRYEILRTTADNAPLQNHLSGPNWAECRTIKFQHVLQVNIVQYNVCTQMPKSKYVFKIVGKTLQLVLFPEVWIK